MVRELLGFVGIEGVDAWVVEDFILDPGGSGHGRRDGLSPERVISCLLYGLNVPKGVVWLQTAGLAQGTFTDERLRRVGGWVSGMKDGREAVRHALTWERRWLRGDLNR